MKPNDWKQQVWILALALVLIFVVNPELRALVLLIDVLSLEVFLLFVGLQVKGIVLLGRGVIARSVQSLVPLSAVATRHLGTAFNALSPRVPLALLAQQTLWAARIQLSAPRSSARSNRI